MIRQLPNGKAVSSLGFGCSSIWSKPHFPEAEAAAILAAAVVHGINHFDTAPSYAEGEARLGAFLAGRDASELVISTKVGTEYGDHRRSFDPERMRASFAGSLRRLGVASVDILYLHGPAVEDLTPEVFAFFDELKAQGLIRYSGVNSFAPRVLAKLAVSPIDAVMLQYSIADRASARMIDELADAGKIVIAGTVMGQGIFNLSTFLPKDRKSLWYLLRVAKNDPLFFIRGPVLARRLAKTGLTAHEAAIRFAVSHPRLTSSLFGTSKLSNMIANATAGAQPLSAEQLRQLA